MYVEKNKNSFYFSSVYLFYVEAIKINHYEVYNKTNENIDSQFESHIFFTIFKKRKEKKLKSFV